MLTFFSGPLFIISLFARGPLTETKTIVIPRGSSVSEITTLLDQNNILIHPILFRITARFLAKDQLKAGEYQFTPGLNVMEVAALLRDGKVVLRQVTAAEGLTSHEIATILQNTPALTGEVKTVPPEGSLLPETYRFTHGDSRESLIDRMQKDAAAMLAELWEGREGNLPLKSPREALILASIVEKETGKLAAERPLVASVFINRMRVRMPLQSDPTVIYALTGGTGSLGRSLTRADLSTDSPYNTYMNAGLPPTPICNPGRAAMMAVLHPEKSDYLYFVANGTGGHAFAKTLTEHNQNVAKWISLSRP
ncbi:MAG TPA: endolytic transglycosylase MltG [Rhodospirillaceae bacterium]|nr:endolytic transglycosylase MltG [Rhodospirillaceae bacterium]